MSMMDKLQNWWYVSNSKKSSGGMIFMGVAGAVFIGVLVWIFTR